MTARAGGRRSEAGFTLVELMIAVGILGVGLAFAVNAFLGGWQLWKRTFDDLLLQSKARRVMGIVTQALREAKPGTLTLSSPSGMYSRVDFVDGRGRGWAFKKTAWKADYVMRTADGVTTTTNFLTDNVAFLSFTFPSFQDRGMIDVGITLSSTPYTRARKLVVQLSERVMFRNP